MFCMDRCGGIDTGGTAVRPRRVSLLRDEIARLRAGPTQD